MFYLTHLESDERISFLFGPSIHQEKQCTYSTHSPLVQINTYSRLHVLYELFFVPHTGRHVYNESNNDNETKYLRLLVSLSWT